MAPRLAKVRAVLSSYFVIRSSIDFGSRTNVGRVIRERSMPGLSCEMIPIMIDLRCQNSPPRLAFRGVSYLLVILEDDLSFFCAMFTHLCAGLMKGVWQSVSTSDTRCYKVEQGRLQ